MIKRKIPYFNIGQLNFTKYQNEDFLKKPFVLLFSGKFTEEKVWLEIPGALKLQTIRRSYTDNIPESWSLRSEGCFYFKEEDELILEAICTMCLPDGSAEENFVLRLPLSAPFITGNYILYFDGSWVRFLDENGELLNENSGVDCFCEPKGPLFTDDAVTEIKTAVLKGALKTEYREFEEEGSADLYSPWHWNAYAGDVMNFYHNGVYHLIYLLDRRHHGSRNGRGAHYITQLTSTDLINWEEQESIDAIDSPWKTFGTGTMLYHDGKYYMSYGLHTERYNGGKDRMVASYDEEKNEVREITFEEIFAKGGIPGGGTYAVSEDGCHFVPSKKMYHWGTNPSAYTNDKGGITMYSKGKMGYVWESEGFGKPFKSAEPTFNMMSSIMKNTMECPSAFEWNGYRYMLVGFTGYFRTLQPGAGEYADAAPLGENIYEGLGVPMVTKFGENRRLMAGWLDGVGWGSVIVHRELIQEEGGRLGMKWVPEMTPKGEVISTDEKITMEKGQSYLLEMQIDPKEAKKFAVMFKDKNGKVCNLELDFAKNRAQINAAEEGTFAEEIPSMYEQFLTVDESIHDFRSAKLWNTPTYSKNFCIPDVDVKGEPFTLKILCRYVRKLHSTVIDAEIAGKRTLVSLRADFFPEEAAVMSDGEVDITAKRLYQI